MLYAHISIRMYYIYKSNVEYIVWVTSMKFQESCAHFILFLYIVNEDKFVFLFVILNSHMMKKLKEKQ